MTQQTLSALSRPQSSLPLQIMLYFDSYYTSFFCCVGILVYIYKGELTRDVNPRVGGDCAFIRLRAAVPSELPRF